MCTHTIFYLHFDFESCEDIIYLRGNSLIIYMCACIYIYVYILVVKDLSLKKSKLK